MAFYYFRFSSNKNENQIALNTAPKTAKNNQNNQKVSVKKNHLSFCEILRPEEQVRVKVENKAPVMCFCLLPN
jgi:hypothetical protein